MADALVRAKICSINGCQGKHYCRGYCQRHYYRVLAGLDPLGVRATVQGEPLRWLNEVALTFSSDECLIFPFSRDNHGYGQMRYNGKTTKAHRVVVAHAHGPKPNPKSECIHSCGNGRHGCVNPRHLRWGSHAENMAEAAAHGSIKAGRRSGKIAYGRASKIDDEMVVAILRDLDAGMRQKEVARKYDIGRGYTSYINRRAGRFAKWPANIVR